MKLRHFQKISAGMRSFWRRWAEGILAYFHYRITNAISEGINNKIKVLKRRSYGFHDDQYFFLNLTSALCSEE